VTRYLMSHCKVTKSAPLQWRRSVVRNYYGDQSQSGQAIKLF